MQIHELQEASSLGSTEYVPVDNGTTTRKFKLKNAADQTVSFTTQDEATPSAWKTISTIATGTLSSIITGLSGIASNVRWLYGQLSDMGDAVSDLDTDVSGLSDTIGNTPMGTTAATVTGAVAEINVDVVFSKLRDIIHIHSDTAASTANEYKALAQITIPANDTGYDIVYRLIGTCATGWNSSVAGSTVGLSIWGVDGYGTADHINRDLITDHITWTLGMRSVAYVSVPDGSDERTMTLYIRHSVANAPLTDINLSYEAFVWTKAS